MAVPHIIGLFLVIALVQTHGFLLNKAIGSLKQCQVLQRGCTIGGKHSTTAKYSTNPTDDALIIDQALDSALGFLQNAEVAGATTTQAKARKFSGDDFDMFEIYSDSPDFVVPYELIAELEEREAQTALNRGRSSSDLNAEHMQSAVIRWRKHENDVGSSEVQIAIADEKIKYLTKHLLANRKDLSAKRGLQALVVARRKFLDYLTRTDPDKARLMVQELGIRFRNTGQEWDKVAKYGAFTNTKAKYVKGTDGKKRRLKK